MGLRYLKPVTPSSRGTVLDDFSDITTAKPEKKLVKALKQNSGHSSSGRITTRHKSKGHKKKYRIIDFKRNKDGIKGKIVSIEYDPNRNARIALVIYSDGEKRYIIAPVGLKIGEIIENGASAEIKRGNTLPLQNIPAGSLIYNIELKPGKGGQIARSAGTFSQLMAKEGEFGLIQMPSGEIRKVSLKCRATIGQVSNPEFSNIVLGKAGRKRHRGIRPTVRGMSMNPVDHPHGGGEGGRQKGYPYPMTPWGKHCKGKKTRKVKASDKLIVRRKKKSKRGGK